MPSRNTESHFSMLPRQNIVRSKMDIETTHKTTFNASQLIPIYVDQDILPGDTWSIDMSSVVRMTTPLKPIMDNLYMDIYAFAIPHRLVWEHWKEFNGENKNGAWVASTEYTVPMFTTPDGGAQTGTLMDYMGIPIGVSNLKFSQLPIRAYCLTWNEWFRDQNVTAPITDYIDDTNRQASNTEPTLGGEPLKVYKFHDYFTSALPEPQKGTAVSIPLGTTAPVITNGQVTKFVAQDTYGSGAKTVVNGSFNGGATGSTQDARFYLPSNSPADGTDTNLYTDLTSATAATINALRLAATIQQVYEKDARGGTRYTEIIRNHFGVLSPDARLQRPEYLGGKRIPINIQQIVQQSESSENQYLGQTGAMSQTADSDHVFTKSFTEHTIVLIMVAIRQDHTYQQGLERQWSRERRFDYYLPLMANLGEQPILMKEIYATGTEADDDVFGYQERWAEYRYRPSRISGEFRSTYARPLDSWHLGDLYEDEPILSTEFLKETDQYINRVIAVNSSEQNQFIGDFFFKMTATRPMPIYSIPGIDRF